MIFAKLVPWIKTSLLLFKYDTDLGAMLIEGFIRTALWAVAFVGGVYLVRNNPLIYKILIWPVVSNG